LPEIPVSVAYFVFIFSLLCLAALGYLVQSDAHSTAIAGQST
jgi:hypothetical protein